MNSFVTQTNAKKNAARNAITFAIIILIPWAALIIYSLLQNPPYLDLIWISCVCFGLIGIVLVSQVYTNNVFTLTFEGNVLYLDGKPKNAHYRVYDIPASDFVITQSEKDKAENRCSLRIKRTVFNLKYVENCSDLRKYIEENFPKK